ncbi:helix-turn-helix domain-containing protein [Runella aurantiaca]|uniref:XRE family transcriptional regulator n=1 Tax=Runella aurantiaca TaxID=2282308 RepID=A0A369IEG2_9BACT|nr:helix-turn-helix transcriptional regulator [Runella aurantiaca]RDB05624.1 XRE family transcriptional regulator [Runella aurantiaca]
MTKIRDNSSLKRFGSNLPRLRESKGLSQEELYFRANLSKNQVGNIERGEVNTTISIAYALAQALEIEVSELFQFEKMDFQGNLPSFWLLFIKR